MPLRLLAILLALFEFINLAYLAGEEEIFDLALFSFTFNRISIYLIFLLHLLSLISALLLWFRRRIGMILFISAALLNFALLELIVYVETGWFGVPQLLTWAPFVMVIVTGVIYRKSLLRP